MFPFLKDPSPRPLKAPRDDDDDGQETTYEWSKDGGTMRVQGGSGIVPSSQPSSAAVPVASTPNPINPNNSDSNSHNEPADGSTSVEYDEEDADY